MLPIVNATLSCDSLLLKSILKIKFDKTAKGENTNQYPDAITTNNRKDIHENNSYHFKYINTLLS